MIVFRTFLVAVFLVVAGYTLLVIANHGMNLLPVLGETGSDQVK